MNYSLDLEIGISWSQVTCITAWAYLLSTNTHEGSKELYLDANGVFCDKNENVVFWVKTVHKAWEDPDASIQISTPRQRQQVPTNVNTH
jgi:hypothetical protein